MEDTKKPDVMTALEHMVKMSAIDGNVYPQPAVGRNGDNIDVIAFALNASEIFDTARKISQTHKYDEFAFGLDRRSQPDQGVDPKYSDVYTIFHHLGDGMWEYWIIPYTKGDVGEMQPASAFWAERMDKERLSQGII